jgi:hypothetical protein
MEAIDECRYIHGSTPTKPVIAVLSNQDTPVVSCKVHVTVGRLVPAVQAETY